MTLQIFRTFILLIFLVPVLPRAFIDYFYIIIFGLSLIIMWPSMRYLNKINFKIVSITILIILFSVMNFLIYSISISAVSRFIQLMMCVSVLLATANYNWSFNDILYVKNIIRWLIVITTVLWIFYGFTIKEYFLLFANPNCLGGAAFCYIALLFILSKRLKRIDICCVWLALFLALISGSRSALMSILIFLVGKIVFSQFEKGALNYRWCFWCVLIIVIAIPVTYLYLYNSPYMEELNILSIKYFRKNFFSGRQALWGRTMEFIKQHLFLGNGMGVTLQLLFGESRSAHNWYLQVLLQMGVIGLVILLDWIAGIWNALYDNRRNNISRGASAFLIGVLVWQCFEVSITQNNLPLGIAVWVILGIGISGNKIESVLYS